MTLERMVLPNELGDNKAAFRNYAVAYYDGPPPPQASIRQCGRT
jgi:hypothetical protein